MSQQERLNDELLVLRCQEGDREAFAALVGRWQPRLWRHAWRLTGDEGAAWMRSRKHGSALSGE